MTYEALLELALPASLLHALPSSLTQLLQPHSLLYACGSHPMALAHVLLSLIPLVLSKCHLLMSNLNQAPLSQLFIRPSCIYRALLNSQSLVSCSDYLTFVTPSGLLAMKPLSVQS